MLEASLELFRETGDELGLVEVLRQVGTGDLMFRGNPEECQRRIQESFDLARKLGDSYGQVQGLAILGMLAGIQGDLRQANRLTSQALALVRTTGNPWSIGGILFNLGWLAILEGDSDTARMHYEEVRHLALETGDNHRHGLACLGLGMSALSAGQRVEARALLGESLRLLRECNSPGIYDTLSEFGHLAVQEGRYASGVRLLAAGASRPGTWRILMYKDPVDTRRETSLSRAALVLGEKALQRAWAEGEAMGKGEAINEALAVEPAPTAQQEPLSARQLEVASLVAEGFTNAEIAERLVISLRTAETHVNNILNKLGFSSRAQIASWTAKRGVDAESHSRHGP